MGFPRVAELFGVGIDDLDCAAIERAVAERVAENEQLDWKSEPYPSGKGDEIAKDVASFANHLGGVIIIGVAEDQHGRASGATPFKASVDSTVRQITQACLARIEPYVHITATPIPATDGDAWFLAIIVPKSADAPHAVRLGQNDKPQYAFPVRDGTGTRWLRESEVAPRYRDRYAARSDIAQQLIAVHERGVREFARGNVWLSVACLPVEQGSRPKGSAARTAELGFLQSWLAYGVPGQPFNSANRQRPLTAIGRTMFSDKTTHGEPSQHVHIELGHDGAGMCARLLAPVDDYDLTVSVAAEDAGGVWLAAEKLEWAIFTGMHLLAEHAIDTGAAGDIEFIAQLHRPSMLVGICVIDPLQPRNHYYGEWPVAGNKTTAATTTIALGPTRDNHAVAAGAYLIGTDILAEFGIDEPRAFTIDGVAITEHFGTWAHNSVAPWIAMHLNGPQEQSGRT